MEGIILFQNIDIVQLKRVFTQKYNKIVYFFIHDNNFWFTENNQFQYYIHITPWVIKICKAGRFKHFKK